MLPRLCSTCSVGPLSLYSLGIHEAIEEVLECKKINDKALNAPPISNELFGNS